MKNRPREHQNLQMADYDVPNLGLDKQQEAIRGCRKFGSQEWCSLARWLLLTVYRRLPSQLKCAAPSTMLEIRNPSLVKLFTKVVY